MKVDRVYSDCDTIVYPAQLPYWHCCEGNAINMRTIDWCKTHVLGYWGYWFDKQHCLDHWDLTPQIAYIGFSNSIDLFMFKLGAPSIKTDITDLRGADLGYC